MISNRVGFRAIFLFGIVISLFAACQPASAQSVNSSVKSVNSSAQSVNSPVKSVNSPAQSVSSSAQRVDFDKQGVNTYPDEIALWHQKRIENLKSENGWLNLEGLYWLEEGKNSFGTDAANKIVFPAGTINEKAGYLERSGNAIRLVVAKGTIITVNGKPVNDALIYNPDSTRQPVSAHKDLRWTIIKRDDKIGIRLRNLKSKHLAEFEGVQRFDVDSSYRVKAILQTSGQPKNVLIKNVLGQSNDQKLAGKLLFTLNGKQFALDAIEEGSQLFIIFGDATSGESTYISGRFLYATKPGANGETILDFNKAINPPCAFTEYATCPLPPPQNILAVAVNAGEKNYRSHN